MHGSAMIPVIFVLFVCAVLCSLVAAVPFVGIYSDAKCRDISAVWYINRTCSEAERENVLDVCAKDASRYMKIVCAPSNVPTDQFVSSLYPAGTDVIVFGLYEPRSACTDIHLGWAAHIADGKCHSRPHSSNGSVIAGLYSNGSSYMRRYDNTVCAGKAMSTTIVPPEHEDTCKWLGETDAKWYRLVGTGTTNSTTRTSPTISSTTEPATSEPVATDLNATTPSRVDEVKQNNTEVPVPPTRGMETTSGARHLPWLSGAVLLAATVFIGV